MHFSSLTPNADGLYEEQDMLDLFDRSIMEYDRIMDEYALEEAA